MYSYQDYLNIGLRIIDLRGFTWNHRCGTSEMMYWDGKSIIWAWRTKRQAMIAGALKAMQWEYQPPMPNCRCSKVMING